MNLFSLEFLIFLLATFFLYYVIYAINKAQNKIKIPQWLVLVAGSLLFYGFSNYVFLIYLGASFFVSYFIGLLCQYKVFKKVSDDKSNVIEYEFNPFGVESHMSRRKYENIITALSILINVGILAVLKYYNFFAGSVNSLFHVNMTLYNFVVPIGISFYTFSLIAYNVDCCKRVTKAELNPLKFLLFVSYFPKILQGPISSYDKLKKDGLFDGHSFKDNDYLKSFFRIAVGLIKKIVIANVLNVYVNGAYSNLDNVYGGGLLITSFLYTVQLYCDFSGFADITIGISGLFGIKLEENFDIPYISASIQEFWRRWHITLGAWLRKYIYLPLRGNRVPIWRWILNVFVVWLVSGVWHGANWTFILWGLFHGALIVINGLPKQIKKKKGIASPSEERNPIVKVLFIILTFLLVNFSWILFRSDSISQAGQFIGHMVQIWKPSIYSIFSVAPDWLFVIAILFVFLLIVLKIMMKYKNFILLKIKNSRIVSVTSCYIATVAFVSLSLFIFLYLNSSSDNQSAFLYFNF